MEREIWDIVKALDEDGVTLNWTIQLMEWYGDYVGRKVKQYYR